MTTGTADNSPVMALSELGAPMAYSLTYAGLFLFTLVLYIRPNDLLPIGQFPVAKIIGVATLVSFLLEELSSARPFGTRPKELKYLLGFLALMVLSIPLALSPGDALGEIRDVFLKVVLIFVVLVSVTTSYERLLRLVRLTVFCGAAIAVGTLHAFLAGEDLLLHYRATGVIGGMFGNPNDLAFALCLLIPLAFGLCLISAGLPSRLLYLASIGVMTGAVLVTYSRGGFLTLVVMAIYLFVAMPKKMSWFAILLVPIAIATILINPSLYTERILSIFSSSLDQSVGMGSAAARMDLLMRSIQTFAFNPKVWLVGIGVANFHIVSIHEQVTHNAYLEVLTDVGLPAFLLYLGFLVGSFKGLAPLARRADQNPDAGLADLTTLAVAIRASLLAYMVGSFFASVAYLWYVYYVAGFAICLREITEAVPNNYEGRAEGPGDVSAEHRDP